MAFWKAYKGWLIYTVSKSNTADDFTPKEIIVGDEARAREAVEVLNRDEGDQWAHFEYESIDIREAL